MNHLRDSPLHDYEVRVVNVQLYRLKQAQYSLLLHLMPIEDVFGDVGQGDLRKEVFSESSGVQGAGTK